MDEGLSSTPLKRVLTEDRDKRDYIKKTWRVSSGRKITEMLLRYWKVKPTELKRPATMEEIKEIFGICE
jgi:hypothetical protein